MDKLPYTLLLDILSRLDNSADVARCRVAFKSFDTVFPELRSINLVCSRKWLFKKVFLDLISKLRVVESVCIRVDDRYADVNPTDGDFAKEWLPRVSESLKSLSLSAFHLDSESQCNVLPLISTYCHILDKLKLSYACLSLGNLNPMPMLTSLTLSSTRLEDEHLNMLNKCFPNLQLLNLVAVKRLQDPKIHLLNLKTYQLLVCDHLSSLTLITPNLITLIIYCSYPVSVYVEAPMLSHFHLSADLKHAGTLFTMKKFENLKTLWLDSLYIGSLLSEFPITKTVQKLTLNSRKKAPTDAIDLKLSLGKVFMVFPNVSSLRIRSGAWSKLEACLNPDSWEILDGRIGLKTICAYLMLVDPSLTFSFVAWF